MREKSEKSGKTVKTAEKEAVLSQQIKAEKFK
jgi:hypothetical protein